MIFHTHANSIISDQRQLIIVLEIVTQLRTMAYRSLVIRLYLFLVSRKYIGPANTIMVYWASSYDHCLLGQLNRSSYIGPAQSIIVYWASSIDHRILGQLNGL